MPKGGSTDRVKGNAQDTVGRAKTAAKGAVDKGHGQGPTGARRGSQPGSKVSGPPHETST
jgi:hypothetical protein